MKTEVILSKNSSENEIKSYFKALLQLSKSDERYPVNLDQVWPLVYERRDNAVKALIRDFVENDDFQPLRRKAERSFDGKFTGENKIDYYLTLPCLEYFIVKKVRPVFEVYRQVFHKTVYQIPQTHSDALMLAAKQAEQLEQAKKEIGKLQPKADFADIAFETADKVDIGQTAKILNLGYGRNTLFQKLKEKGIFFANRNEPKQQYVNAGYFELKEQFITRNNHPLYSGENTGNSKRISLYQ